MTDAATTDIGDEVTAFLQELNTHTLVLRCLDDYLAGNSASLALLGDVE